MINKVTVTNYLGESIELELRFPERSGFLIQEIKGLNPCKATVNSTELSTMDGSIFNSSRVNSRNIVFNFKLLPDVTMEDTRRKLYKYFPIKKRLTLLIETDNLVVETYGYVESNEINIFSSSVTAQISIICPDSYFYSAGIPNRIVFAGLDSKFEFPFSNESTSTNLIEMGSILTSQEETINYSGDAEVGIIIYIHVIDTATGITIYNTLTREVFSIDEVKLAAYSAGGLQAGDDIVISTIKGDKYINLIRGGETVNILNAVGQNSDWFQLTKGANTFTFIAATGHLNLEFIIENQTLYEGV